MQRSQARHRGDVQAIVGNGGAVGPRIVRTVMDEAPLIRTPATDINEVRHMMLDYPAP